MSKLFNIYLNEKKNNKDKILLFRNVIVSLFSPPMNFPNGGTPAIGDV